MTDYTNIDGFLRPELYFFSPWCGEVKLHNSIPYTRAIRQISDSQNLIF